MTDIPTPDSVQIKQTYSQELAQQHSGATDPDTMAGIVVSTHEQKDSIERSVNTQGASPYQCMKQKPSEQLVDDRKQVDASVRTDSNSASGGQQGQTKLGSGYFQDRGSTIQSHITATPGTGNHSLRTAAAKTSEHAQYSTAMGQPQSYRIDRRSTQTQQQHNPRSHGGHRLSAPLNQLIEPRMYNSTDCADPVKTHYTELMRRSLHRLVSSTTRFDQVTNSALSLLSDAARLYLVRIGEACRSRADLANRSQPNLLDVVDCTTQDLGVDWPSLRSWVEDWKDEVGTVAKAPPIDLVERASTNSEQQLSGRQSTSKEPGYSRRNSWGYGSGRANGSASAYHTRTVSASDILGDLSSTHETNGGAGHGNTGDSGDIDAMLADLDLDCLLLDESSVVDNMEGIIPSHFPPLVPITEQNDEDEPQTEEIGTAAAPALPPTESPKEAPEPGVTSEESDGKSADEDSPESVLAQLLHLTTSSLSVLQPPIKNDKALFAFFQPAAKFDPTCAPDETLPDFEIPEEALASATDHICDELSRRDKVKPGHPMFLYGDATRRNLLGDSEEQWRQARYKIYSEIHDEAAGQAIEEMNNAPIPMRRQRESVPEPGIDGNGSSSNAKGDTADIGDSLGLDVDMDMDVELGMDLDLDLDILDSTPELKSGLQYGGGTGSGSQNEQLVDMSGFSEMAKEPSAAPEPIELSISSGLRGSGKPHWTSEWFTPAMAKRLSAMTAQDIAPCDSLFLSSPSAGHRHVVDDIARAFVDSEGGGHLHETTPLEGFGSNANAQSLPNSSGSALRWTLHHIMQTKGTNTVDSLYTGRSSLAGGVAGDGVNQYISRISSLIKASEEEEAELAVNGALGIAPGKSGKGSGALLADKGKPGQGELVEQLVAGSEKRIPWTQHRLDIHAVESRIAGRPPQKAVQTPPPQPPTPPSAEHEPKEPEPRTYEPTEHRDRAGNGDLGGHVFEHHGGQS
ncbi:hypothetical protein GQ54DRAFT_303042 [Martensiomyces pterosporus]|nr:hypothetical protein GQ54DRAFT_303042 [Martensiomyces pterosporus]